ncbi:unnamed protein product [Phaedon cochleariae]|uniref:DUF4806 domain-containing protein n=1 Tax=Phaedon cochleariae TaxID=80249 RepID=A0A9P0DN93_PHACE|nr:unnamed protein product [Phaedon cochleariae]
MATWTVVKFQEENSVEAIPTTWLMGNNNCYWPPYTQEKIQHAIKKHDQPNTCWPLHKIEVFKSGTYDNYLQARSKAKKAEIDSDLNSDCDYDKTKRRARQRRIISDDSSKSSADELEEISWHKKCSQKKLPTPPKIPTTSSTDDSVPRSQPDHVTVIPAIPTAIPISISSKSIDEFSCCCCPVHKSGDSLRNIMKQQILMRNILTQVVEEIQNLRIPQPSANINEESHQSIFLMFNFFPINSDEHLILLEEYLGTEKHFRATVDEFSKLGGSNLYDFIKRCLNVVISNSFASQFSWQGAKKKRVFRDLKLAKLILVASEQSKLSDNQKATEEAIKKWLRRAKERSEHGKGPNENNN